MKRKTWGLLVLSFFLLSTLGLQAQAQTPDRIPKFDASGVPVDTRCVGLSCRGDRGGTQPFTLGSPTVPNLDGQPLRGASPDPPRLIRRDPAR